MIRVFILTILIIFLPACGENPPVPVDHFYNLNLKNASITPARLSDEIIYVEEFRADGIYNERALLYTNDENQHELLQYHYHFWALSPAAMLREHLVEYLRQADSAPLVVSDFNGENGLRISGRLQGFEKRIYEEKVSVRVAIEFRIDMPGHETPGLIKRYESEQAVEDQSIRDVVAGFNRAVNQVYGEFLADAAASQLL